jgi:hypothetical protein
MNATYEPGLSGTGPSPIHLHAGRPTPWSEGYVVRFEPDHAPAWIGNLQGGWGYANRIIAWDAARAIIVIAKGAAYFVRPDEPQQWKFIDSTGIDCLIVSEGDIALLTTYTDVVALAPDGSITWRRSVAVDGVEIERVDGNVIFGRAEMDPPGGWQPFHIKLSDGSDADRC